MYGDVARHEQSFGFCHNGVADIFIHRHGKLFPKMLCQGTFGNKYVFCNLFDGELHGEVLLYVGECSVDTGGVVICVDVDLIGLNKAQKDLK